MRPQVQHASEITVRCSFVTYDLCWTPISLLIYPSAAIAVLLSPTDPCGSEGGASSSSDEPALDDSSSLSASIHSLGLELKKHTSGTS